MNKKQKRRLYQIGVTLLLLIPLNMLSLSGITKFVFYFITYLIIGYDIILKAINGIKNKRLFDESFLMTIATIGVFGLALYTKSEDYGEAVGVMLFYQIGEFFQSYAVGKSRNSIADLMDIRPDYANIERNYVLERVRPDELPIGSIIVVQPGEKVPLDGVVIEGASTLNTSALTGESLPREVKVDDEIISGCINLNSILKVRTTKEFGESTVSKILELVENATSRKSKSEEFITKFARYYTPFVCYAALVIALLPPVFHMLFLKSLGNWEIWIYRALTFLVISCPCALVISIPLSFFAGIGGASREGILIKGSNYLETLAKTKLVLLDKTGTLTYGNFEVKEIHNKNIDKEKLLEVAALAECASSHPISKSLQKAFGKLLDRKRVSDIEEISGLGITARIDGSYVAVGNAKLMAKEKVSYENCDSSGTAVHVAIDKIYVGCILISDSVKEESLNAISELRRLGIEKIVMLTGDNEKAGKEVADFLKLDAFYANLLPSDKISKIEEFLASKAKEHKLAFVGDGINDAPVLASSDVGIAMGGMGSDAAIEAADVVLMEDNPLQIGKAIKISRKCLNIVRQNIVFALTVKFLFLFLGAIGYTGMWAAIFADVGVMLLAVLNAMRALN